MAHIAENWADALTPATSKIFDGALQRWDEKESMIPVLFNVKTSERNFEVESSAGDLGDWDEFTGTMGYEDSVQGYDKTYTFTEYCKGIKIERKLWDDDLFNIIAQRPKLLGYSGGRTREKHGAQVFNLAFSSTSLAMNGETLCADSHTNAGDGATQDNKGSTALSAASVEATRRLMIAFKGDKSQALSLNPDTLIVETTNEEAAYEIINSKGKVDTLNNNVNFSQGRYKLIVWKNFLSDTNNWFMADYDMMKEYLVWYNRIMPEYGQDKDSDTLLAKYYGYMRYGYGTSEYRWVYGHNV